MKLFHLLPFVALITATSLVAQTTPQSMPDPTKAPCGDIKTSRPSIMVIPRVKEGQNIRTIIDDDFNIRVATTKVQEAFNSRGFTTVDFVAKLKAATTQDVFTGDAISDYKTQLLQYANPDIYVEVDYSVRKADGMTIATVLLTGYDCATGNNLGAKDASRGSELDDPALLVGGCMTDKADEFLNVMQTKFTEMIEDGRQVTLVFKFADGSEWNAESEVPAKDNGELSLVLEDWVSGKAVKNNYAAPRTTSNAIYFDDVRIPLRDAVTCKNYTTTKFRSDVTAFLKSCGIMSTPTVNGAQIMMTIK